MSKADTIIINGIKYIIRNKEDIIENCLYKGIQWNNDIVLLIGLCIKKYRLKHFVNIGCHIGTIALPISKYIKKVSAIEAYPPTFKYLQENIKINKIKNITSYNVAVGDSENVVYFFDPLNERVKNNLGGMHAITNEDIKKNRLSSNLSSKQYENLMKKFDDLPINEFDILLIDVEGHEYEAIKGGYKKIKKNKPIIIIEIWENSKRRTENMETTKEDVVKYIENLDYKLFKKINDNYVFFPNYLKI